MTYESCEHNLHVVAQKHVKRVLYEHSGFAINDLYHEIGVFPFSCLLTVPNFCNMLITLFMMLIQAEAPSSQNAAAVLVNRATPISAIKGQSQPSGGSKISTEVRILLLLFFNHFWVENRNIVTMKILKSTFVI
jgi:hypothetical protein